MCDTVSFWHARWALQERKRRSALLVVSKLVKKPCLQPQWRLCSGSLMFTEWELAWVPTPGVTACLSLGCFLR